MTCATCGDRCGDRWTHPELYEDYYCAYCYVELIDHMIEELVPDQNAARKAIRQKTASAKGWRWIQVPVGAPR